MTPPANVTVEHGRATAPTFQTERFVVSPLGPTMVRELAKVLLQDELLADQLPWMSDHGADGAAKEAFLLELQCAAGHVRAWGIVHRVRTMYVGMVLARASLEGMDIEVLCASQFWDQGISDEIVGPVVEWLEETADVRITLPH
jgi:hypothetical protein